MLIRPLIRMIVVQHPAFVCFSAQIISPGSPKSNLLSFALGHRLILKLSFLVAEITWILSLHEFRYSLSTTTMAWCDNLIRSYSLQIPFSMLGPTTLNLICILFERRSCMGNLLLSVCRQLTKLPIY